MKTSVIFVILFSTLLFTHSNILAQPILLSPDDTISGEMVKKRGERGKELFDKAMKFFLKKEYEKAIEYCKKVIVINPDDYEINFTLGMCYARKGDFKKAVEYYQKSTNTYPNELLLIAMTTTFNADLDYSRSFDEAVEYYKNEITKNQNNYQAYNDLGYISFLLKPDSKSEDYFKKSIEIRPDYAQAHYNLAVYYLFSGNNLALEEEKILEKLNSNLAKVIQRTINEAEKLKNKKI